MFIGTMLLGSEGKIEAVVPIAKLVPCLLLIPAEPLLCALALLSYG